MATKTEHSMTSCLLREKRESYVTLEHFNPFEGTRRATIALDKEDAQVLYKTLTNFLK